jgi:hypothetical protein
VSEQIVGGEQCQRVESEIKKPTTHLLYVHAAGVDGAKKGSTKSKIRINTHLLYIHAAGVDGARGAGGRLLLGLGRGDAKGGSGGERRLAGANATTYQNRTCGGAPVGATGMLISSSKQSKHYTDVA